MIATRLADQRDLGKDVGAEQHGVIFAESADDFARFLDLPRVEARGGLIQQQYLGLAEQRLGETDALPVSLREFVDLALRDGLEPARLDHAIEFRVECRRAARP